MRKFKILFAFFLYWLPCMLVAVENVSVQKAPLFPRLMTDGEAILMNREAEWRNPRFELFRWEKLSPILFIDTTNYATQSLFFKRLAFFTEKAGYAGKILNNEELDSLHGYRAHNYSAYDLALFFNSLPPKLMNREERQLLAILEANNILFKINKTYHPVQGGILAISQGTMHQGLRRYLFIHELLHGIYYCLPVYRQGVKQVWDGLSDPEKKFWNLFLKNRNYDTDNRDLVINEFHAYVLQQFESSLMIGFYNQAKTEILTGIPEEESFMEIFEEIAEQSLKNTFRTLKGEMKTADQEAGFEYFHYLESLKEF